MSHQILSSVRYSRITLIAAFFCFAVAAQAQNIDIHFTGIKYPHGQIIVKVFVDEQGYQDNKAITTMKYNKTGLANGELKQSVGLEPGTYGFALVDDENGSGKMDFGFLGMPKEGFGFSNYYLSGMKKPKFDDFKFTIAKDQKMKITMKIRYM